MQISANGIALIKRFEGFSPRMYICPAGYPTIGYGHVVHAAEPFASEIDEATAEKLLRNDLHIIESAIARLIRVAQNQNQYDALISFTYNLGAGRLQMSRLRQYINRGEEASVPREFQRWVYVAGHRSHGLVARRAAEASLYATPIAP